MLSVGRVRQKYVDCLYETVGWLNNKGYSVYPKDFRILTELTESGDISVRTSQPFHLRDWPFRSNSSNKLDMLVSFIETLSQKKETCIRSTINVTYFRVDGKSAIAIESLHYDCNVPAGAQHPICHAQNSHRPVESPPDSFTWEINDGALRDRCQCVRVPTAFINMPGLFTILAADHMSSTHWCEFMAHCLKRFQNIPGLGNHALVSKTIPKECLSAWAWYER